MFVSAGCLLGHLCLYSFSYQPDSFCHSNIDQDSLSGKHVNEWCKTDSTDYIKHEQPETKNCCYYREEKVSISIWQFCVSVVLHCFWIQGCIIFHSF